MSRRRVVVTGLGCISPVGNTVAEAWANLLAGKSGIAAITRFDASGLNCHFAGEVKNFDIDSYISPKDARAMDSFIHYGIAAAVQAVQDAGLPTGEAQGEEESTRVGVLTRDFLLQHVWGYEQGLDLSTKVVDVTLSHLRDKLGPPATKIVAVRGFGYRFDE